MILPAAESNKSFLKGEPASPSLKGSLSGTYSVHLTRELRLEKVK